MSIDVNLKAAFKNIYENDSWGAGSGTGSRPENNVEYIALVSRFLRLNNVKSVVDLGCGDWQFSQYISWKGIDYKGFDVVPSVIEANRASYRRSNVSFHLYENVSDLPEADLYICKDVFQHLPNSVVAQTIDGMRLRSKWCLITNDDYGPESLNKDIKPGAWRAIRLDLPPFNQDCITLLDWTIISETPLARKRTELVVGNLNKRVAHVHAEKSNSTAPIPKILYQTWKSRTDLPANFAYWRESFLRLNNDFEFMLWDDQDNRDFIEANFPWFKSTYDSYAKEICRVDAVRYFFLYVYGGFYADLDVECLKPLAGFVDRADVLLGQMGTDPNHPDSIPNAIMASRPRQEFWLLVIWLMMDAATRPGSPEQLTGPILLKSAVELYRANDPQWVRSMIQNIAVQLPAEFVAEKKRSNITTLPSQEWFPLAWTDAVHRRIREDIINNGPLNNAEVKKLFPNSSMVTFWSHSW